jgi:hypothetical protein
MVTSAAKSTRRGLGDDEARGEAWESCERAAVSCPPPSFSDAPRSLRFSDGKPITMRRHASSQRAIEVGELAVLVERRNLVPRLSARTPWELARTALGPREAFLLSRVDGALSVEDLADLTGIPESEVLAILRRSAELDLVEL